MRILIAWADDVSPNLGVRALGRGSLDLLKAAHPGAEFEVMNYGSKPPAVSWTPRTLIKRRLLGDAALMDWLASFDVYWDTRSGDSFTDIYGLERHLTMSLLHEYAAQSGVQCVMAPQTIGPFSKRAATWLATRNLKKSRLVFARDLKSADAAAALGRPVDALTTDLVFAIAQPQVGISRDVILNISGLLWQPNPHVDYEEYRRSIRLVIEGLRSDGRSIALLPHVLTSTNPDSDIAAVSKIHDEYEGEFELLQPESLDEARSAVAAARLVIGARMHACLNALSTGTPAIAMAYSRKFRPLLAELGWNEVVEIRDASSTSSAILRAARSSGLRERASRAREAGQARIDRLRPTIEQLSERSAGS